MENSLRNRFVEILNHSPLVVWALDKDGVYTVSEGKPLERMGLRRGELVGKNHFEIFKDNEEAHAPIRRALAGETLSAETNFDGNIFTTQYSPLKDAEGNIIGVTGVSTDITDLKNAQMEVFSERENFRSLFKQTPEMVCILKGPDHLFEFVNEAHVAALGFDATGKTVREAQPESVEVHGLLDSVYQTGVTELLNEIPVTVGKKLRYFDLTYAPRRDIYGKINGVLILGSEVTHKVEVRNALAISASKMRTIADTMPQIAWSANPRGEITYANRKWYEYSGLSEAQTMHHGLIGTIAEEDRAAVLAAYSETLKAGATFEVNARMIGKDGANRWFLIRAVPHRDGSGAVTEWFGTCTDIDAQKQTERILEESAEAARTASKMKTAFLANMSHEIRTPLGAILGFTELLRNKDVPDEERTQYLETIARNGQMLTKIIDDILDLSKVEAGKLQVEEIEFSLPDLAKEVVSLLEDRAKLKGISIRLDVASTLPERINSDPVRLRQILINIVGNAIKFTTTGGIEISINGAASAGRIAFEISVADTGIGLSAEQSKNLFQPFTQADSSTTRKFGGTGLGLVLSRRLARALGGDITVKPNSPRGSIFMISFNASADTQRMTPKPSTAPKTQGPLAGLKILAVDDSPDNRMLIEAVLKRTGAAITTAESARMAIELVREENFDAILMDIQMPGMDGYEATKQLRQSGYLRPIIALTAHAMAEERARSRAAGCDAHLTKPLDFVKLTSTLEAFCSAEGSFRVPTPN